MREESIGVKGMKEINCVKVELISCRKSAALFH
jgi:hypothetical protein